MEEKIVLQDAKWLIDKDGSPEEILLPTIDKIMIDSNNVEIVEIIKNDEDLEGTEDES